MSTVNVAGAAAEHSQGEHPVQAHSQVMSLVGVSVAIPRKFESDGIIYFELSVTAHNHTWTEPRRYREFYSLRHHLEHLLGNLHVRSV